MTVMSKTNDTGVPVPSAWRAGDGLESQSAVGDALAALAPLVPRGWEAALARARAAEFEVFRATSTGLGDDVLRLEGHLAEMKRRWNDYIVSEIRRQTPEDRALDEFNDLQKPTAILDLELGIRNTETLLAHARALYLACPEEEQRVATLRAREDRARRYHHRATPTNDAEIAALLDLADQVRADEDAAKAEQAVVRDLVDRATDAQHAARKMLVRELVGQIHDHARACKTAVGSKALRHGAFPQWAPPEIGASYQKALYLRGLVVRLGGDAPDVDDVFCTALGEDDWRTLVGVFRLQIGRYPTGGRRTK
jgi:hypothetical protein